VDRILETFKANVDGVYELAEFDHIVLETAISAVEDLQEKLKQHFENRAYHATNALMVLKNIRQNDSLRPKYKHVFNQCVVLLVSYFSSAVADVFRRAFCRSLQNPAANPLQDEEMKLSLREIIELGANPGERMSDVFVQKRDISFQDMQSILRTFKHYWKVELPRDKKMNDIILGQAARHVIVHAAGLVDEKMVAQVANARPRDLKEEILVGAALEFSVEEIRLLGAAMVEFVDDLEEKVGEAGQPIGV
jgi:hypothetical protein